jgi:hypothetical protein
MKKVIKIFTGVNLFGPTVLAFYAKKYLPVYLYKRRAYEYYGTTPRRHHGHAKCRSHTTNYDNVSWPRAKKLFKSEVVDP